MSTTKAEVTLLAKSIANLDHLACRVQVFNELVPWVRKACKTYRIIDFYDHVFGPVDIALGGKVRWNNVEAKAELTDVQRPFYS